MSKNRSPGHRCFFVLHFGFLSSNTWSSFILSGRLQQYLYYHHKNRVSTTSEDENNNSSLNERRPRFKILTVFSCKAREKLALMDRPDLAGVLSFEPRPSQQATASQWSSRSNVTEVTYCDQRTLTTLQLGMISHKKSLITIFGHKYIIKNFIKRFSIFLF